RIDEQESQLGLVARVAVIVERAQGMEGGEPPARQRRRRLADPHLRPVGRQDAEAVTRPKATLVEKAYAPPESIAALGIGEVVALVAEGDPLRKSPERTDHEIGVELWIVLAEHASPLTTDERSVQSVFLPVTRGRGGRRRASGGGSGTHSVRAPAARRACSR